MERIVLTLSMVFMLISCGVNYSKTEKEGDRPLSPTVRGEGTPPAIPVI